MCRTFICGPSHVRRPILLDSCVQSCVHVLDIVCIYGYYRNVGPPCALQCYSNTSILHPPSQKHFRWCARRSVFGPSRGRRPILLDSCVLSCVRVLASRTYIWVLAECESSLCAPRLRQRFYFASLAPPPFAKPF